MTDADRPDPETDALYSGSPPAQQTTMQPSPMHPSPTHPSPTQLSPAHPKLDELVAVLAQLRAPGGCAWDREQTHGSLVRYLIEETHELVEAIEAGSRAELIEELGDVLYQVIFHADIAAHAQDPAARFDIEVVAEHMTKKMIVRHPHVFANRTATTADEVVAIWDEVKSVEKSHRTSSLEGIPMAMPSLLLAEKLIGKAERLGVVIAAPAQPRETAARADAAGETDAAGEADAAERLLGAQLLAIVVSARARGLDAERALRAQLRHLSREIRSAEQTLQSTPSRPTP